MRVKKTVIAFIVLFAAGSLFAQTDDDFQTEDNADGSVAIVKYTGRDTKIIIPAAINGKQVTSISGFDNRRLTSVVIPEGVKVIKRMAFYSNNLTSIIIPNSVTFIGDSAFWLNPIENIAVGTGITYIGVCAFFEPRAITLSAGINMDFSRSLGAGVFYDYITNDRKAGTYYSGAEWREESSGAFNYIAAKYGVVLTGGDVSGVLNIPETLGNLKVKVVWHSAFRDKNLRALTLPSSITYIGRNAFAGNQLTSVAVPASVTYLAGSAFSGNPKLVFAAAKYKIGGRGPAGGIIFYDKGAYTDGWRYLEAAPKEAEFKAEWGAFGTIIDGGSETEIGGGRRNTEVIAARLGNAGESGKAAQRCAALKFGGFNDWFLPDRDELNLMYKNLKAKGSGGFGDNWYWTSSEGSVYSACQQRFKDGLQLYYFNYFKSSAISVRPARAF